ncbi:MbnP family protein [Hwangdonia lutea]|uniref:MbnP family protein n=1 Tax=Hwangdonia lutea TaxID=3075823 RepID=A0AA97HRM0_9FLAO|nr:MbnP family protein [Hwangdonia sp. SCSIO 19198]WOD44762.1 MbnP family protein [Hwangdonia sp. SCSIO 19198]
MKKIVQIVFVFLLITSCSEESDDTTTQANITFNFTHNWDGTPVSNANFNSIQYTNANGEQLSITKLRYLISKFTFQKSNGEKIILDGYNLVDVSNGTDLSFTPTVSIPTGNYNYVYFTFGFDNDANYNGNYPDLNSASWSVPSMLGGGYHFMQLEGKFIDNTATETGYAYHAIRAVDNSKTPQEFQDTFFEVDLGAVTITNNTTFNIEMNIAEWFKNPNTWDLNVLNNMLMPNFNAQIMMFENGQNVFSLKTVTP